MNLIHLAIPVFFLLIAVELVAARLLEKDVYRLSDSVSDLSCGILDQIVGVFLKTALFAGYVSVYDHVPALLRPERFGRWPGSPASWESTSSTTASTASATR